MTMPDHTKTPVIYWDDSAPYCYESESVPEHIHLPLQLRGKEYQFTVQTRTGKPVAVCGDRDMASQIVSALNNYAERS